MIRVNVVLENKLWNTKIKKIDNFFNSIIKFFPQKYKFKGKKVSFSVLLSNNKSIKKLNKRFRKKNKSTDILSFPCEKKPYKKKVIYLGDIIVSYDFMNKPKSLSNFQFKDKVLKIFIHGFLHLLNYDHIKLKDFKKMMKEEEKIYNFVNKKIEKSI
jgi:probable rRNA maturation factor|tara:strand:+ start:48 stop:518 length:471 start_codon:yes stop_codon:yes gene_type:complete